MKTQNGAVPTTRKLLKLLVALFVPTPPMHSMMNGTFNIALLKGIAGVYPICPSLNTKTALFLWQCGIEQHIIKCRRKPKNFAKDFNIILDKGFTDKVTLKLLCFFDAGTYFQHILCHDQHRSSAS